MAALPARRGCRGSRPRPGSSARLSCRTPGCWPRRCGPATLDTLEVVRTQALDCRSCRCCGDGEPGHNAFSKANRYNRTRSLAFRFIHTSEDHNLKRLLKLIIDHHGRCRLSHRIISPVTLQVADNPGLEANPVPRAKPGTPPAVFTPDVVRGRPAVGSEPQVLQQKRDVGTPGGSRRPRPANHSSELDGLTTQPLAAAHASHVPDRQR